MKSDPWYKNLLKVWLQDANVEDKPNDEVLLSKYIAGLALLQDLRDAFYDFQKKATEYVSSEQDATLELLSNFQTRRTCN